MQKLNKIIILLLLAYSCAFGLVDNTKHNLSTTGPGSIKSLTETEVCVFCHIPHSAQAGRPLWNRSMPSSSYTLYESDYLDRLNYPKPTSLGASKGTPGSLSRQCLSCHDGTIAIGDIYLVRGNLLGDTLIDMMGVDGAGMMPVGAMGNIGTDLSLHHPVGYEYDPSVAISFGEGSRDSELKLIPDTPIRTYTYSGKKYIECSSCHDPHTENKKFLRVKSGANHGQNVRNTCTSCHDKSGGVPWPTTHEVIGMPYRDAEVFNKYGTYSPSDLFCINCHTPHNGEGSPYLLRKIEQQTCFQGAASSPGLSSCHGTGAPSSAPDIQSVLSRSFSHPVMDIDGVHTNLDTLYGTGVPRNPPGSKGLSWSDSKHAECVDCHNPHRLGSKNHVEDGQWYPTTPSNAISDVLRNVNGIEPNWTPRWTQPTTFTTLESSTKEYQICLKCHSYWALGDAISGVSSHFLVNEGIFATDQAWEFNPNNRSAHPVVMSSNSMPGSYEPKSLEVQHMREPWTNVGNQTMYCSDCHGADNEIGGDPKGPHGSNFNFMLKGENNYWPRKPDGTLYTVGDIYNGGDIGLFCKNCHDLTTANVHQFKGAGGGGMGGGSFTNFTCVNCHVTVPHGSPVSRLIGYSSFPEPYNYEGNSLMLSGYTKTVGIARGNASSNNRSCRCHGMGGGGGGYDSYP